MSRTPKLLIGLLGVLLMGWLWHGPLGNGEAYVARIEADARRAVAATELPEVDVRLSRDPISRAATLSGPANQFQREGQGSLPGLSDIVGGVEGVSAVGWGDEGGADPGLPLLAELLIGLVLAYALGLGVGRLLFGRPKKESYL